MATHFPTVPVEVARKRSSHDGLKRLPPVVLVVDDEPMIANTLAAIMDRNGLAAIIAADYAAALDIAQLIPPQLLLSDVELPDIDGFELAIKLTRRIPDCEVILFSGQYSTSDLVAMHRAEGRDFLTLIKPVHPVDLLACVFERLSLHGWPVPAGFIPRPPNPFDVFSPGVNAIRTATKWSPAG